MKKNGRSGRSGCRYAFSSTKFRGRRKYDHLRSRRYDQKTEVLERKVDYVQYTNSVAKTIRNEEIKKTLTNAFIEKAAEDGPKRVFKFEDKKKPRQLQENEEKNVIEVKSEPVTHIVKQDGVEEKSESVKESEKKEIKKGWGYKEYCTIQ